MILSEYQRFILTNASNAESANVRKLTNLILTHIDELIPLSSSQGQRVKRTTDLAKEHWGTLSQDLQTEFEQVDTNVAEISQLSTLTVGPFRGFSREEAFDLAN